MALTKISTGMLKQDAASSDLNIDAGTLYLDVSNNRVGIANTSPSQALDVTGNIAIGGTIVIDSNKRFLASDGAANVPYIAFAADTNTGLYRPGADTLGFSTGGSERMRIDASGNVGIGTSAPTTTYTKQLHIHGAGGSGGSLHLTDGVSGATGSDGFELISYSNQAYVWQRENSNLIFGTNSTERVRIDSSGNMIMTAGGTIRAGGVNDLILDAGESSTPDIYFSSAGSVKVKIEGSNGNVGIGTTAPSAGLHIENSSGATLFMGDTNGRNLRFRTANSGSQNTNISSYAGLYLGGADNQNHMLIDGTGKVGIGTTSPNNKLEIQHSTVGTGNGSNNTLALRYNSTTLYGQHYMDANGIYHILADASGVAGGNMQLDADTTIRFATGSTPTERMRIDGAGRVLIGTTDTSPWNNTGTDTGIMLSYDGWIAAAASSQSPLELNRMSNDGNIINLRKDGAIRGRIANDSTSLVVTGSSTGLKFGSAAIWPTTGGGVTNSNGAKDLGASTVRFKDLYLSGTATCENIIVGTNGQITASNALYKNANYHVFRSASESEYARFNQFGDFTIGTTDTTPYNNSSGTGLAISSAGQLSNATHQDAAMLLNRMSTDGSIIDFKKDGTTVGSIGTRLNRLYTGTGDVGVLFDSANNTITPENTSTSASRDAAIDIGRSNIRFKDLHLSGTVNAGTALVENAKLKAIAESNTDTAVDVFVYDTRKDSDGGAWRKRTQHTSWYNETLNTSTRGSRREFPCVAVIVAESAQVTIYDGDDPDMPMWMVFNHSAADGGGVPDTASSYYTIGPYTINSLYFLNGNLAIGTLRSAGDLGVVKGLTQVNFVSDQSKITMPSNGTYQRAGSLSTRNEGKTYYKINSEILVNGQANDVAMTVLPNAPIDADTGLPVPTIAVATNGGVSVIKDDGSVVDITHTNYTISYQVKFLPSGGIGYTTDNSSNQRWLHVDHTLPSSDNTKGIGYSGASDDEMYHTVDGSTYTGQDMKFSLDKLNAGFIVTNQGDITVGSSEYGIGLIARNPSLPSEGLIAEITSDYNTGYMHGDIKLATLSDTDTTNAASTDLLGGIGNFTDANDWTVPSGWSLSSNVATGSAVTAYLLPASNGILTAGKKYAVTVTQSSYTSGAVYMYMGTGAPSGVYYSNLPSTVGTFTYILTAYNSNFGIYGANYTGVIDNVTISLAEEDRSYNDNGLQVFGTVTKSAVETGAELVGYYGWGTNNYLEQPYTTDLDFGAGDFCMMWWQKKDALTGSTAAVPIEFSNRDVDIDGTPSALVYEYLNRVRFYTRGTSGGWHFIEEPTDLVAGAWQCYAVVRRGGKKEIWRNGKLAIRDTAIDTRFVTSTSTILRVGKRSDGSGSPFDGMISLVRVTATVPSEKQIAKMYNDEKHLFATNAKATLYGSSDAVTALAYDDDTELLHIGTSAGRSVFQGLNRVDNTTDAVGAAISASNGFIVEE